MQVVDDNLVAAIRTKRRLDGLGDSLTGLDVADNGTIFSIMATVIFIALARMFIFVDLAWTFS